MTIVSRIAVLVACCLPSIAAAQHEHEPAAKAAASTEKGQAAFAAIGEIVALLRANPTTDWTRVNVEALRLHLIDMDDVLMRSIVTQTPVPGGIEISVTGTGPTVGAIQRMAVSHARTLDTGSEYAAAAEELRNGARLRITARDPLDIRLVAIIRGLGFAGIMTEGDHHARHHLALARGDVAPHR